MHLKCLQLTIMCFVTGRYVLTLLCQFRSIISRVCNTISIFKIYNIAKILLHDELFCKKSLGNIMYLRKIRSKRNTLNDLKKCVFISNGTLY